MDSHKLSIIGSRLFNYEVDSFLIGVSSGQIAPPESTPEWLELKHKVQCNKASEKELRLMVDMCNYERLVIVYELMDELQ